MKTATMELREDGWTAEKKRSEVTYLISRDTPLGEVYGLLTDAVKQGIVARFYEIDGSREQRLELSVNGKSLEEQVRELEIFVSRIKKVGGKNVKL